MHIHNKMTWFFFALACLGITIAQQRCSYGERGSLTSTCVNATPSFFKSTPYKFDHLDETMQCINCNLSEILANTFDISGNNMKILNLTASRIRNMKEASFVGLVFLKRLYLPRNYIKTIVPETFRGIKKLEYLDISNNTIVSLLHNGFKELIQLKTLLLQWNSIKVVDPQAFNGLVSLEELNLSYNQIPHLHDFLKGLNTLIKLDLNYNEVSELKKGDFEDLGSLLTLDLSKNKLLVIKNDAFNGLTNLERLDLSSNPLESLEPAAFRGLFNLNYLDLSSCRLAVLNKFVLRGIHNLRTLNLASNHLTSFETATFSGLPELRALNLSMNNIVNFEQTGVKTLGNLHSLDLSFNKLSDLKYRDLVEKLPVLSFLGLKGNSWPCYLKQSMEEYFDEDVIIFEFSPVDFQANCIPPPSTISPASSTSPEPSGSASSSKEARTAVSTEESPFANAYVVYTFMTLIFIALGVLFFLQFRPASSHSSMHSMFMRKGSQDSPLMTVSSNDLARDDR